METEFTFVRTATSAMRDAMFAGLDLLPIALFATGKDGHVLFQNRAATRLLRLSELVRTNEGVLEFASQLHNESLRKLIARAASGNRPPEGFHLSRPSRKPLSVLVLSSAPKGLQERTANTALVFISDPELPQQVDTAMLEDLFGFTPAEARVASLLMKGCDIEDVSAQLYISKHTTRNHMRRLFSKTNTRRQSDLVHTLLGSPAHLATAAYDEAQ